jgi:hypothetical protein
MANHRAVTRRLGSSYVEAPVRLRPAKRDDHVAHPGRQDPLPGPETIGNALRAQASLLDGSIAKLNGHVVIGHAVESEGLHLEHHGLLFAQHPVSLSCAPPLPLTTHGHRTLIHRIVALRENFSAYDAPYVALAEDMGAALLTADRAMTRAVQKDALVEMMAYENP